MPDFYDKAGKPITLNEWAELSSNEEYRRVALSRGNGLAISTVWLGLNHDWSGLGPPLIFETMVFADDGGEHDGLTYREPTIGLALQRHNALVSQLLGDELRKGSLSE